MTSIADLDNRDLYRRLDPSGFGGRIAGLPEQCRDAWVKGLAFPLPDIYKRVERVLVLGMGGSAIGGELLADLQAFEGAVPVVVHRDYGPARPVDDRTLLVAASYSGNTEETLSAFERAWGRGTKAVAATRGGALAIACRTKGVPLFPVDYEGEPRSALGYGLFALLAFVQRLGLAQDRSGQVQEAIGAMQRLARRIGPETPAAGNPAKQMASAAHGRAVVVFGAQHLSGAARRWKTQIAENAKAWAFFEALPELHHNSIEGTRFPDGARDHLLVVLLRSSLYHPRVALRFDISRAFLAEGGFRCSSVEAEGEGPLAHMMTAILFGDYVSYYLAMLNGVDPAPVPTIERLKARLAGSGQGTPWGRSG